MTLRIVAVLTSLTLAACGGTAAATSPAEPGNPPGGSPTSSATLTSLSVSPASAAVPAGAQEQVTATAHWSDGTSTDITTKATWTTSATTVAHVFQSSDGLVWAAADAVGAATVTASWNGKSGAAQLTVGAAALASLQVSPGDASIAAGTSVQLYATGLYTDGTRHDLTAEAVWGASDGAVAAVAGGLATAASAGSATITARVGTVSGSAKLNVTAAVLSSIEISPADAVIALGTSQPFTATGIFSDYTTQDLSAQATWSVSDATIAGVSAAGVATGAAAGTVTVSAAYSGVTGSIGLTVTSAVQTSLDVSPAAASIAAGTSLQLAAAATFSDGSVQDVTAQTAWSPSPGSVVGLAGSSANALATGAAVVTGSYGGFSDTSAITVTAAKLVSIAVSGADLPNGTTSQLSAIGTFGDGSTQDLTAQVVWSSSDATVATVSNAPGSEGVAQGVSPGVFTAFASVFGITGSAQVTVTSAAISSVAIGPATPSVPAGYWTQLTATATFSDGSTKDLTSQVVWSSSNTAVATVANSGVHGAATGIASGTATITAHFGSTSASATLTVFSAKLSAIAIAPATLTLAVAQKQQVAATGTWANGFSMDVTTQVKWSSSNRHAVLANNTTRGLVSAVAAGSATVTASRGSKSGTLAVTVQ